LWISLYAALNDGHDFVWELGEGARAMGNGCGAETVEFVKDIVDGGVGYEVIRIVFFSGETCRFVYEGRGACEGVVDGTDQF